MSGQHGPPVRVAIVGAGGRGRIHAECVRRVGGVVVAVAEPRARRREALATLHDIDPEGQYADWVGLADAVESRSCPVDAVVIATQDTGHVEPAVRFAELGVPILCEKPIAPTEAEARRVCAAVERAGVPFSVSHPLRYAPYTQAMVELVRSGRIGEVVSVQHLEPVGTWHFAHSYVRGAWRREEISSSLLMAKCSHDIDLLTYLVGEPPARVASFGTLSHFRSDKQPAGAADRCVDCAVEAACPYSAPRLYRSCIGDPDWEHQLLAAVTDTPTESALDRAMRVGPYGRCVYRCDNDVVDHQVVALEFASGVTASHTVTAFSEHAPRQTRVFGTHGGIDGDGQTLHVHDFRKHPAQDVEVVHPGDGRPVHREGDERLVAAFLDAVRDGDVDLLSGLGPSMESHRLVWAAETARRTASTVALPVAAR